MARRSREHSESGFYHFITRGVSKKKLFHSALDFTFYLKLLNQYRQIFEIQIYHYCLMTNHTHVLLKAGDTASLSRFGYYIQRRYAYYYCKTHKWTGQVFQSRFKSLPIEKEGYLLECGRYIERNPLRAKLVKSVEEYPWSSYHFYASAKSVDFLEQSPVFLALSDCESERRQLYQEYLNTSRPYEELIDQSLVRG